MKLTSPHLQSVEAPTLHDLGHAFASLVELGEADPSLPDRFVLLDADDGSGAFAQAIAVDGHATWHVEVSNSHGAALRGLKAPVTRGPATAYLTRFLNGERSLGNGPEWTGVDVVGERRSVTPTGLAVAILLVLAAALAVYFRMHGHV